MEILFRYISYYRRFLLFCLLFFFTFSRFIDNNSRQNQIFFGLFKSHKNKVLSLRTNVNSIFSARENNEYLSEEISKLRQEILEYKYLLEDKIELEKINTNYRYKFISAKVIKVTANGNYNYFLIDKGFNDGLIPDMGVLNNEGVLGVVDKVYEKYSVVLSLFNRNIIINSKLKSNENFGSIFWEGNNKRFLSMDDIPYHLPLKENDTILTTGYSFIFPKDIPVGILRNKKIKKNSTFYSLEIEAIANFSNLNYVYVLELRDYNFLKKYNE